MATSTDSNAGEEQLRSMGFDPSASSPERLSSLRELHGREGISKTAIARELGRIPSPEAAALLEEMESGASGSLRREIRRALFKLHQRGVVHESESTQRPAQVATISDAGLSAMLSPADADGARVIWLLKSRPGGVKRLWCLVSESEGMVAVTLTTLSRRELRGERAELERRAGVPLIEADWRLADFIANESYRRTSAARRPEVGSFPRMRAEMIAAAPTLELEHPIYAEMRVEAQPEPSAELMREPEIAGWHLPPEVIKPYASEIESLKQSVLVLNRLQQEERVTEVVGRAINELLTGETGYRLRRHLEDSAYYFARTGRKRQAGWAAGAALRMRDGADLHHLAFFQTLMRAQLGAVLAEEEEKKHEEPRLIITPAEAMRAQQQARMRQRR
jgi:hypothetical protein